MELKFPWTSLPRSNIFKSGNVLCIGEAGGFLPQLTDVSHQNTFLRELKRAPTDAKIAL
jgi:hypothetical protein